MDYARAWEEQYVETVVRRVHDSDGIVSWCHPFGVRSSPAVRKRYRGAYRDSLLAVGIGGTDVLEVGFRKKAMTPLHEYLAFWDEAGRRGIAITGIGVNDSHGVEWASWENNFATWVAAPAGDAKAMLRAIRTGHVFFGDPLRFRGRLELAAGSAAAGDIVVGSAPREVTVRLVDAPPGTRVRLMADGVPRREWSDLTGTVELHETFVPGETTVVRAELWGPGRTPLAFTNPLYLDPEGRIRRGGP